MIFKKKTFVLFNSKDNNNTNNDYVQNVFYMIIITQLVSDRFKMMDMHADVFGTVECGICLNIYIRKPLFGDGLAMFSAN